MEHTELPTIEPSTVEDDEALGAVVDAVIAADPVARERATSIDQHQRWLRCVADPDAWKLVLEIDARTNERSADLAVVLVRWGFDQGRRCPLSTELSP